MLIRRSSVALQTMISYSSNVVVLFPLSNKSGASASVLTCLKRKRKRLDYTPGGCRTHDFRISLERSY
jgi:hypothetical protein